jgi:hypothetical protein
LRAYSCSRENRDDHISWLPSMSHHLSLIFMGMKTKIFCELRTFEFVHCEQWIDFYQTFRDAFLALKWPIIWQPDNHIDLDSSMPFASINPIFMEINSWMFGQKLFTNSQFKNKFVSSPFRLKWWRWHGWNTPFMVTMVSSKKGFMCINYKL